MEKEEVAKSSEEGEQGIFTDNYVGKRSRKPRKFSHGLCLEESKWEEKIAKS